MLCVLRKWEYWCGSREDYPYDDDLEIPPVEGAQLEVIEVEEKIRVDIQRKKCQEARLDDNGNPYIYEWYENVTSTTWEDWCLTGSKHTQEKSEDYMPHYIFTRVVSAYRWTLEITDIARLESLFKAYAELDYYDGVFSLYIPEKFKEM